MLTLQEISLIKYRAQDTGDHSEVLYVIIEALETKKKKVTL